MRRRVLVIELGDPGRKLRMVNHAISLARADFDVQAKTHFSAHIMTLFHGTVQQTWESQGTNSSLINKASLNPYI